MTGAMVRLTAGDAAVEVDPTAGGRLTSWRVGDLELLGARGALPEEYGCYPMAPWPGRLRGNRVSFDGRVRALRVNYQGWAMHGTVLSRRLQVVESTADRLLLQGDLGPEWPWAGEIRLVWHLRPDSFHSQLTVSADSDSFPAELGWHPWFRRRLSRGEDLRWHLNARAVLENDAEGLPTGRRLDPTSLEGPFDHAFDVPDGRTEIIWPGALHLSAECDAQWVVVFDELEDVVCLEPQTAPPDGLGPGAPIVRPGHPREANVTWTWAAT